jgi:hypothetical protein
MLPVQVKDHGKEYVLYVCKYEFSEGELAVLNDDICGWIGYLFRNDPLADFSYRESQIVLEIIKNLCGISFDFLSYEEWKSACLYKKHEPHGTNIHSVDIGEENEYGLVNISDNVPEYTSDYDKSIRLGIAADSILQSFNTVIVAGSAYTSSSSIDSSVVNKNLREGGVGFRLVYRPANIGARKFIIKGICRKNQSTKRLPNHILLLSVNGCNINTLYNYETFEELLIENRFKKKTFKAIDLSNSQQFTFTQSLGLGLYDFEPIFSFVGVDN